MSIRVETDHVLVLLYAVVGCCMLYTVYWMLDAVYWMLDAGSYGVEMVLFCWYPADSWKDLVAFLTLLAVFPHTTGR